MRSITTKHRVSTNYARSYQLFQVIFKMQHHYYELLCTIPNWERQGVIMDLRPGKLHSFSRAAAKST